MFCNIQNSTFKITSKKGFHSRLALAAAWGYILLGWPADTIRDTVPNTREIYIEKEQNDDWLIMADVGWRSPLSLAKNSTHILSPKRPLANNWRKSCNSCTIMKQRSRSSPVRPQVPTLDCKEIKALYVNQGTCQQYKDPPLIPDLTFSPYFTGLHTNLSWALDDLELLSFYTWSHLTGHLTLNQSKSMGMANLKLSKDFDVDDFFLCSSIKPSADTVDISSRSGIKDLNDEFCFSRAGSPVYSWSYLGSVILRISLANRPMKFTEASVGANLGMGIAVDWYTLCQSSTYRETY